MKALLLALFCLQISSLAMAFEVDTECSAMNESRETIVKTTKEKSEDKEKSSQQ